MLLINIVNTYKKFRDKVPEFLIFNLQTANSVCNLLLYKELLIVIMLFIKVVNHQLSEVE
jgi:hypothetical protein